MNRSRAAFASLLFFAAATSLLAGWGLLGSLTSSAGPAAAQTSSVAASAISLSESSTTSTSTTHGAVSGSSTTVMTTTETTTTATATTTSVVTSTSTSAPAQTATTATTTVTFAGGTTGYLSSAQAESYLRDAQSLSILLAPVAWVILGGAWMWRGRVRAKYTELGFGSDVFELFMKMKGGATRIKVLGTLSTPKDRLQLAEELGVDWKTVDRHVQILNKYGFVKEQSSFGTVRLYEVTPMGKMLLNLFDDLERNDGPVGQAEASSNPKGTQS